MTTKTPIGLLAFAVLSVGMIYMHQTSMVLLLASVGSMLWVGQRLAARKAEQQGGGRRRRLSGVTTAVANGGFPAKYGIPHTVVHGTMWFAHGSPTAEDLCAALEERVLQEPCFHRLRSRIVWDGQEGGTPGLSRGPKYWEDLGAEFDVKKHVIVQPSVDGERAVRHHIEAVLLCEPMDMDAPLWQFHIINNSQPGSRSVVVARFHHAVGDGISLMNLMMRLLTTETGETLNMDAFVAKKTAQQQRRTEAEQARVGPVGWVRSMVSNFLSSVVKTLGMGIGAGDTVTCFRQATAEEYTFSGHRAIVNVPDIKLDDVKMIKNKAIAGATVNDVLLSVVAGGVRRYLAACEDPSASGSTPLSMRALIPYAVPRKTKPKEPALLNRWCFLSMELAVGEFDTPIQRLRAAKSFADSVKRSFQPLLQFALIRLASVLPWFIAGKLGMDAFVRHSMVFTNVPGPPQVLFFAGKEMDAIQCYIANAVPQVSSVSYNGTISISIVVDHHRVNKPDALAAAMFDEFEALREEAAAL